MKKITIIHHNDLDGVGAAAIVANALGKNEVIDITFVMYCYTDESAKRVNDALGIAALEDRDVYIVDITISNENIDKLSNVYMLKPGKLFWLDHHASSVEWIKSTVGTDKELHYDGIVNPRRSGAYHAYTFMHKCKSNKVPRFVKYIDDYDRYVLSIPDSKIFNQAFYSLAELKQPGSLLWNLIADGDDVALNAAVSKGRDICEYLEEEYKNARKTRMFAAPLYISSDKPGYRMLHYNALCINHSGSSDVFGEQRNRNDIDICVNWSQTKTGAIKYSLRSSHNWVRCDLIAKALGGGGHKLAAGVSVSQTNPYYKFPSPKKITHVTLPHQDYMTIKRALAKRPSSDDE